MYNMTIYGFTSCLVKYGYSVILKYTSITYVFFSTYVRVLITLIIGSKSMEGEETIVKKGELNVIEKI